MFYNISYLLINFLWYIVDYNYNYNTWKCVWYDIAFSLGYLTSSPFYYDVAFSIGYLISSPFYSRYISQLEEREKPHCRLNFHDRRFCFWFSMEASQPNTTTDTANPNPIPNNTNSILSSTPVWPTIDGPLGLTEDESLTYARRFYKFGFALLPWLWAVNCFYFWPVLFNSRSFPRIRPCK